MGLGLGDWGLCAGYYFTDISVRNLLYISVYVPDFSVFECYSLSDISVHWKYQ